MNIIKQRSTWSTPAIHDETANCLESHQQPNEITHQKNSELENSDIHV